MNAFIGKAKNYLGPFGKNRAQPKTKTKKRYFCDDASGIAQNLTSNYCLSTCVPEKCPFFNLRSNVALIWTRAIRPVIAQSVQSGRIVKRLSIDLYQFFRIERENCSH